MLYRAILALITILIGTTAHADRVKLRWDRNLEEDVAGYRVYYGNHSRDYPWKERVRLKACNGDTCKVALDLPPGRWYFAVTAYDGAKLESKFSKEVVGVVGAWIDKVKPLRSEPGGLIRIYGEGFGKPNKNSKIHIGSRKYGSRSSRIKVWRDNVIKLDISNYNCKWFGSNEEKKQKVWVTVDGDDSNTEKIKVVRPKKCSNGFWFLSSTAVGSGSWFLPK